MTLASWIKAVKAATPEADKAKEASAPAPAPTATTTADQRMDKRNPTKTAAA